MLLARDATGYRSLCRLVSRANLDGTKRVPRFTHALLDQHREGLLALSGGREGEIARRLLVGDRAGARAAAERYAALFGRAAGGRAATGAGIGDSPATAGFFIELSHHLLPDDDWLVAEDAALADELGLPVVVTNDVHYARPEDRELHDVLTGIFHGRTLETLDDLRRPDGESYLKSGAEMAALPPGSPDRRSRMPGRPVPGRRGSPPRARSPRRARSTSASSSTASRASPSRRARPRSRTSRSCAGPALGRRYHPLTPAVVKRLAHELDVIERAGLAEFFLICWDLMRFAKEQGIPAQGRGSATSSIVSYTLGISRVEPIAHNLLFERFINEGRTTYPDVDIDFSSARREEVIQYVYRRYGPEHTGMVCNLVTYRARSAVREVGYALGFPRPLVDRVAKALETYDSVMVRRDLEADGGFAEFFRRPGEGLPAEAAATDAVAASTAAALGFVDGMGQLNTRVPLVGKVPPWRQPPKPMDPAAPRPFAWLGSAPAAQRSTRTAAQRRRWTARRRGRNFSDRHPGASYPAIPRLPVGCRRASSNSGDTHSSAGHSGSARLAFRRIAQGAESLDNVPSTSIRRISSGSMNRVGPSASGMWEEAPESPPAMRPGGRTDDEGGPGDTPASVAWLRAGRGTGYGVAPARPGIQARGEAPGTIDGRRIDPGVGGAGAAGTTDGPARAPEPLGSGRRAERRDREHPWRNRRGSGRQGGSASELGGENRAGGGAAGTRREHASACPTGIAGSSSAPASMASRGTSRSTRAGCS